MAVASHFVVRIEFNLVEILEGSIVHLGFTKGQTNLGYHDFEYLITLTIGHLPFSFTEIVRLSS